MGCFIPCFGSSNYKHRKARMSPTTNPSGVQRHNACEALQPSNHMVQQEAIANPVKPIPESKVEHEDQLNCSSRKKVTFDLNVNTYKDLSTQEVANSMESDKQKEKAKKEETQSESQTLSDSRESSLFSYPPNHRYHNCTSSDDECNDMELKKRDSHDNFDENDGDNSGDLTLNLEESSESLFSLSIDSRKQVDTVATGDKEVNSPIRICGLPDKQVKKIGIHQNVRDGGQYVHSVLNPIENLSQWKAVKGAALPLINQEKENLNPEQEFYVSFSAEPDFKWPPKMIGDPEKRDKNLCRSYHKDHPQNTENGTNFKAHLEELAKTSHSRKFIEQQDNQNRQETGALGVTKEEELNIIPVSEEASFKQSSQHSKQNSNNSKPRSHEIAVDTSLSSWLAESEKTPAATKNSPSSIGDSSSERRNSSRSFEDRPIFGALTVVGTKHLSASSSPSQGLSPSYSTDEVPIIGTDEVSIIGTVRSYWSHTGQGMDSDSSSSWRGMSSQINQVQRGNQ